MTTFDPPIRIDGKIGTTPGEKIYPMTTEPREDEEEYDAIKDDELVRGKPYPRRKPERLSRMDRELLGDC